MGGLRVRSCGLTFCLTRTNRFLTSPHPVPPFSSAAPPAALLSTASPPPASSAFSALSANNVARLLTSSVFLCDLCGKDFPLPVRVIPIPPGIQYITSHHEPANCEREIIPCLYLFLDMSTYLVIRSPIRPRFWRCCRSSKGRNIIHPRTISFEGRLLKKVIHGNPRQILRYHSSQPTLESSCLPSDVLSACLRTIDKPSFFLCLLK